MGSCLGKSKFNQVQESARIKPDLANASNLIYRKYVEDLRAKIKMLEQKFKQISWESVASIQGEESVISALFAHIDELWKSIDDKISEVSSPSQANPSDIPQYWPKGTGYGSNFNIYYNDDGPKRVVEQRESNLQSVFNMFTQFLAIKGTDKVIIRQFSKLTKSSSCLPLMEYLCYNDSLLDMAKHVTLYLELLDLLVNFTKYKTLVKLVIQSSSDKKTLFDLVSRMVRSADIFLKLSKASQNDVYIEPGTPTPDEQLAHRILESGKIIAGKKKNKMIK